MESALRRIISHSAAIAGGGPGGCAILRWPAELAVAGRAWADGRGAHAVLLAKHCRAFGDVAAKALCAGGHIVPCGMGIPFRRRAWREPHSLRRQRRSRFAALLRP